MAVKSPGAPAADVAAGRAPTQRLLFFDNLRVALTVLVILHHVGQAYGPTGGAWPFQEPTRAAILGPFFVVNRSFFMSLFFMVSGYFALLACDRKGPVLFLRERLLRLGIPLLAWTVFAGAVGALLEGRPVWPVEMAHLWFLQHLLVFSAVYAAWRMLRPGSSVPAVTAGRPPAWWQIVAFALGIACLSAIVRIWYPIDRWVYVFTVIKTAWADVPRDLGMFIVGALAYRKGWVAGFPGRAGRAWLVLGLLLAALCYLDEPILKIAGGASYAIWESLLCVSLCIGLTVFFRDHLARQSPLVRKMVQAQYPAYIYHLLVVMLFHWLLLGLAAGPLAKFALVSLISVPVTFVISYLLRF